MSGIQYLTPLEAVGFVRSGDTIVVQGSTSVPMVFLRALTERAAELRDVKLISGFAIYPEDAPCTIRYEVDDETVATIDENGLITAHEVGSTGFWVYIEYETGAYGCANNVVVKPLEERDDSDSDTNEQTTPDTENETVPETENNANEGKDAFRCKRCDWYEDNKDHPIAIVRCVFWMIHTITHLVQQINSLT